MARSKNTRGKAAATQPRVHATNQRSDCKCNCGKCTGKRSNPGALGHRNYQDVQDLLDYHWKILSLEAKEFVLENPARMSLSKLVDFWSSPQQISSASHQVACSLSGSSIFMALNYMFIGKFAEARALVLNGAFLHQCTHKPIEEIVRLCQSIGPLSDDVVKKELPFYHTAFFSTSTKESMDNFIHRVLPPEHQRRMSFACQATKAKQPVNDFVQTVSHDWESTSSAQKQKKCSVINGMDNSSIEIILVDSDSNQEHRVTTGIATTLKTLFNKYSEERGTSLRSLRFTFLGRTLFLSTVGQKTPAQLGMKNLDVIHVSSTSSSSTRQDSVESPKEVKLQNTSLRDRVRLEGKSKRHKSTCCVIIKPDEKYKIKHSQSLSLLFEEAAPKFKEIRQKLNSLNLERQPKRKTTLKKSTIATQSINDLYYIGLGGKAGKTRFVVQVGEVNNLYKTAKPSARRNSTSQTPHLMVDLHGFTKEQALTKLDESLPGWTDIAMQGSYPFVTPVVIVCGGGNQILSDTVDHWIKQNKKVSNAPKNFLPGKSSTNARAA